MAPKKAAAPEPEVAPPAEEAEPAEVEVSKRCFSTQGQVYYGDCKAGPVEGTFVRHGFGRQVSKAKNVAGEDVVVGIYEGNWENDVMEGHGAFKWPDGSSYEGAFHKCELHGFGRYEWPEGSCYEGSWLRGQMSGQGRFDSRFDGGFLQGRFYRDCFQQDKTGTSWANVRADHARAEQETIRQGDNSSISVVRCSTPESLGDMLNSIYDKEGLIPLIVSDTSMVEPTTAWASSLLEPARTVSVREAAVERRRLADYRKRFHDAVQASLLAGKWLAVLFEDDIEEESAPSDAAATALPGGGLPPQAWRLENFIGPASLPLEAFHPKLFNGRMGCMSFLPTELQDEMFASLEAGQKPGAASSTAGAGASEAPTE